MAGKSAENGRKEVIALERQAQNHMNVRENKEGVIVVVRAGPEYSAINAMRHVCHIQGLYSHLMAAD